MPFPLGTAVNSTFPPVAAAMFVRHPISGQVKTRLAHDIGADNACSLYRAMVADVLTNINLFKMPIILFHDGVSGEELPEAWLAYAHKVFSQQGETLGERMAQAFELLFANGAEKVILVGSDIPGIDVPLLQSTIDALDCSDAAFSPAYDGGYCLVALRKAGYSSSIFRDIPWSTEKVLLMTLDACRVAKLTYTLLDYRQDIDNADDLLAYSRNTLQSAPETNTWLAEWNCMQT